MSLSSSSNSNIVKLDDKRFECIIDGERYPAIGFGTYPFTGKICETAVFLAIKEGYRIIDTATYYKNFDDVAKAIHGQNRRQFHIISKVWHNNHAPQNLKNDLEETLKQLKIDYLDTYLLHWPNSKISIKDTLLTMDNLRKNGKIHYIGLSNVTVNHLKKALEVNVPITWVQIEMHPHFCDFKLIEFCKEHSIIIQAWRPLNLGRVKNDLLLSEIGESYGKTACQVSLRWILQKGCLPLPGSKNEEHIKENFDIADFVLSNEEMKTIDERASQGTRFRLKESQGLGFKDEFDFSLEECWPEKKSFPGY